VQVKVFVTAFAHIMLLTTLCTILNKTTATVRTDTEITVIYGILGKVGKTANHLVNQIIVKVINGLTGYLLGRSDEPNRY